MDCETLKHPTICDIEAERKCMSTLKDFASQTVKFVDELKAFLELEKAVVDEMWKLSVKIKLLSAEKPKLYPPEIATIVFGEIVSELNVITNKHGARLQDSQRELYRLQEQHRSFISTAFLLDCNTALSIFTGNEHRKPLKYFINVGDKIVTDARLILNNIKTCFEALDMNDSTSFEYYKKSFFVADDFLNLLNEFVVFCNIFLKYS